LNNRYPVRVGSQIVHTIIIEAFRVKRQLDAEGGSVAAAVLSSQQAHALAFRNPPGWGCS
jgi:hypothetical protein